MKAIECGSYGPPEVLVIRERNKPARGRGDIVVRVYMCAVTASDCIVRSFRVAPKYRLPMRLALGWNRPRNPVLGMVYAGVVDTIGGNVRSFEPGDAVVGFDRFGFGAYAEYKRVSADGMLVRKPDSIGFAQAAAIPYGGMLALHFLKQAGITAGQRVLIYGASGAVGTAAVQLAAHFGADVTGVCGSSNLELVRSLGANRVIDYAKEDFSREQARYDLIFNAVGKSKANLHCENSLTEGGKHITVDDGSPQLLLDDLEFLMELAGKGEIKPVIDRCYPMEDIVEAHRYVELGHKKGNVLLEITNK
jgi:NADPH:quinone reductase-like Zn-dependent oxidoreductase